MIVETDEFKGNKILRIRRDEDDRFGFAFGVRKAKLMIENIEEIKKFVQENDTQE